VTLSFAIDKAIFGMNARLFYVHHLIAIWLCSVMFFTVLRLWNPRFISFTGACLFLVGAPVAVMSQQLMTRHYLEGLLFSLFSVYFFVKALRSEKFIWAFVASFFYLGAMTAKEVYAPLILMLLVLPEKKWKQRLIFSVPLISAILFYLFWRWRMLGMFVGGYGTEMMKADSVLLKALNMITYLFGKRSLGDAAPLLIASVAVAAFWMLQWRRLLFSLWVCLLVVAPILTIPDFLISPRHFFVAWVMIAILCVSVFRYYWSLGGFKKLVGVALIAIMFFEAISYNRLSWSENLTISRRMSEEGKFFLFGAGGNDVLASAAGPPWYFEGLEWLGRNYYGLPKGPVVYFDDIYLCEEGVEGKKVWTFSHPEDRIREITKSIPEIRDAYCSRVRKDVDLKVRVGYVNSRLSWQFGPYNEGKYAFKLDSGLFPVPRTGAMKMLMTQNVKFRIRYESPDGWMTYSPALLLKMTPGSTEVTWERIKDADS
jgi:hypothetical protein